MARLCATAAVCRFCGCRSSRRHAVCEEAYLEGYEPSSPADARSFLARLRARSSEVGKHPSPHRLRDLSLAVCVAVLFVALPAGAGELSTDGSAHLPAVASEADRPGLRAATWCAVRSSPSADSPQCDAGMAMPLAWWRAGRSPRTWALVVLAGPQTVGAGVAVETTPAVAIGVAYACRWSLDAGITTDECAPVLGATFGFGGGR